MNICALNNITASTWDASHWDASNWNVSYWHAEIGPRPSGTRLVGMTPGQLGADLVNSIEQIWCGGHLVVTGVFTQHRCFALLKCHAL